MVCICAHQRTLPCVRNLFWCVHMVTVQLCVPSVLSTVFAEYVMRELRLLGTTMHVIRVHGLVNTTMLHGPGSLQELPRKSFHLEASL
jgi:hypothetical protein